MSPGHWTWLANYLVLREASLEGYVGARGYAAELTQVVAEGVVGTGRSENQESQRSS